MKKIINLTGYSATSEQGCFEPEDTLLVQSLLTFETIPSNLDEIRERAEALALIAKESDADQAVIGGPPYLIGLLIPELHRVGVTPLHSFSMKIGEKDKHLFFVEA